MLVGSEFVQITFGRGKTYKRILEKYILYSLFISLIQFEIYFFM